MSLTPTRDGMALISELREQLTAEARAADSFYRRVENAQFRIAAQEGREEKRRWETALFESDTFQCVSRVLAPQENALDELRALYDNVRIIALTNNTQRGPSPREIISKLPTPADQARIADALEKLAPELIYSLASALRQIAARVRKDPLTLVASGELFPYHFDRDLVSTRGGRGGDGEWRGLYVRTIAQRVPAAVPQRFSVIATLLHDAGVDVSSAYVRSILLRGRT